MSPFDILLGRTQSCSGGKEGSWHTDREVHSIIVFYFWHTDRGTECGTFLKGPLLFQSKNRCGELSLMFIRARLLSTWWFQEQATYDHFYNHTSRYCACNVQMMRSKNLEPLNEA